MEAKQMTNLSKFQTASYSYDNTKKSVVGFVEDYVLTWNKIEKYDLVKTMLPETVVFLDVLIQLWNDSIFHLPRGLVVWQVSPLDEVPQRPIFHQSTRIHTFRPWPIFHQSTCIHTTVLFWSIQRTNGTYTPLPTCLVSGLYILSSLRKYMKKSVI